ncbi:MAG: hypothetical protein HYZ89_01460 [Candidatus Omnitrophica bacterium]|nr:hypothetical protein [Candidatus Omnitrophota bacterium]
MTTMRLPSRRVMVVGLALLLGVLGAVTATSVWLTVWVPTKGKSWAEAQLRRQLPVDIHIGKMTYSPWKGLLLEDVRAVDRDDPSLTWFRASRFQAKIRWLTWLIRRQLVWHLEGPVTLPCDTHVIASGVFELNNRALEMDVLASDIALDRLSPPVARYLPPALKGGTVRPRLRITWRPGTEPVIAGRIMGTHLLWEHDAVRFRGDVRLDGTVIPPTRGIDEHRWWVDLSATIAHSRLEGLPMIEDAQEVSGIIHVRNDAILIGTLRGTTLDSPWQMEGSIHHLAEPDLDLLIRTQVDMATAAATLLPASRPWQPTGALDVTLVCRGPLARWPDLDIMARAAIRQASVMIPACAERVDHLTGALQYDHLTRRLAIGSLVGRIRDASLTLQGTVQLDTAAVDLAVETAGEVPLDSLKHLLLPESPIHIRDGVGSLHCDLHGPVSRLAWQGAATLNNATLTVRGVSMPLERVRGTIRFTNQELSTSQLVFVAGDQPVVLALTVTDLNASPRLDGRVQMAGGSLVLSGTLLPDQLILEAGELSVGSSHVTVRGSISRLPHAESQLTVMGHVAFTDLERLPWVAATPLAGWKLEGETALRLQLRGSYDDWKSVSLSGVLRAEAMSIRGIPVQSLSAEIEREPQRLTVRLTNAKVADGRLTGEFIMEEQSEEPRSLLDIEMTLVDLAQLAPAIPEWRTRRIEGTVSGHASFLRLRKDRTHLQGQGWLHAKGARLGELPLLDRLFRGTFGALADRLGLSMLRTAQLTELNGQWRVFNARILTDDLQLNGVSGGEPVGVLVRGSVGFDRTLDLVIEPDLSEQLILQAPATSAVSRTVLNLMGGIERLRRLVGRHHIGGTIDKPEYQFEIGLDQLLGQLLPSPIQRVLDPAR